MCHGLTGRASQVGENLRSPQDHVPYCSIDFLAPSNWSGIPPQDYHNAPGSIGNDKTSSEVGAPNGLKLAGGAGLPSNAITTVSKPQLAAACGFFDNSTTTVGSCTASLYKPPNAPQPVLTPHDKGGFTTRACGWYDGPPTKPAVPHKQKNCPFLAETFAWLHLIGELPACALQSN